MGEGFWFLTLGGVIVAPLGLTPEGPALLGSILALGLILGLAIEWRSKR